MTNHYAPSIIFDLDGVLVDTKEIHFEALNFALGKFSESFVISRSSHLMHFDGLPTKAKLEKLAKIHNFDEIDILKISAEKQIMTAQLLEGIQKDTELIDFFQEIRNNNILIGIASNSIQKTVEKIVNKLGLRDLINVSLSNEDVNLPKPHPEIYWEAMKRLKAHPSTTCIFEDSSIGRNAAISSGAHLIEILNREDLTQTKIRRAIKLSSQSEIRPPKWTAPDMNILIPMAGAGSRFEKAGYTFPKPLIDVEGEPMIQKVVKNINIDAHFIYIVQKLHYEKYNLSSFLNLLTPGCSIIIADGITEGAACTTLLATELIDSDKPLFIANSDQLVDWDSNEFIYSMTASDADGGIVVFNASHPKWSFARVDENDIVIEVAEKNPISDLATVGFYYWKKGSDYVHFAKQMIDRDLRVNNEFYICPVYNEAIGDGKLIRVAKSKQMWGLGTPEDLESYLKRNV